MRTRFQQWVATPIFPDEEQTRIAGLLNLLLLALISMVLLDAAVLLIFAPETIPTFWVNGIVVLSGCVSLWIMRRGGVRIASSILYLIMWPVTAYYLTVSGGLGSPTLGFLSLFVVAGVTLFGTRGAIGIGLLNVVLLAGLFLAGTRGLLVSIEAPPTLSRLFATNSIALIMLTALVAISGRSVHSALSRARNGERKLAERNRELQQRDAILEAVSTATSSLLKAADWQEEIRHVLGILGTAVKADRTNLFQMSTDKQGIVRANVRYEWAVPGVSSVLGNPLAQNIDVMKLGFGPLLEQLTQKQLVYIHAGNRPPGLGPLAERTGVRASLYLPIFLHGALWGTFVVTVVREGREWSKQEVEALQIAADMLGTLMERMQVEDTLRLYVARLNTLHQIDQAILSAASAEEIARAAVKGIRQLIPCQYVSIEVLDSETKEGVLFAVDTDGELGQSPGSRYFPDTRWKESLSQGQPYLLADLRSLTEPLPANEDLLKRGWHSLARMPFFVHGKLLGKLDLIANAPDVFAKDYLEIGREVADQLAIAIENARLFELSQRHAAELEQRVKERTEQLEAANRAKSAFLANVNHELRTPLNAVLGFTHLLLHQGNLTAQQRRNLELINQSGQHLLDLISDVLDMSSIEAGRVSIDESSFDLYETIRDVEQLIALRATNKQLHLQIDIMPDVPRFVISDQRKLRQILINLLGNAVKFTDVGNIFLRAQYLQVEQEPDQTRMLRIEVEDTGWGIAEEEIGRLFQPFTQTASGRKIQQGTGLGLAITRQFIQILGGTIDVKSRIGLGTTFTFTIPVKPGTPPTISNNVLQRRVIGLIPSQPSYRILVVGDAEENRQLLSKFLRPLGFEVREATNGQEAIEIHDVWHPQIIFVDTVLPVLDSNEVTMRIKASPQQQATAIIAITPSTFEQAPEKLLSAGCDDYLPKPVIMSALLTKIEQHLGVQYLYEEDRNGSSSMATHSVKEPILTKADILALPGTWVRDLHALAVMADSNRMLTKIEEIRAEYPRLANALTNLVRTFQLQTLLALTSPPME